MNIKVISINHETFLKDFEEFLKMDVPIVITNIERNIDRVLTPLFDN